jgi:hypothetical protein
MSYEYSICMTDPNPGGKLITDPTGSRSGSYLGTFVKTEKIFCPTGSKSFIYLLRSGSYLAMHLRGH